MYPFSGAGDESSHEAGRAQNDGTGDGSRKRNRQDEQLQQSSAALSEGASNMEGYPMFSTPLAQQQQQSVLQFNHLSTTFDEGAASSQGLTQKRQRQETLQASAPALSNDDFKFETMTFRELSAPAPGDYLPPMALNTDNSFQPQEPRHMMMPGQTMQSINVFNSGPVGSFNDMMSSYLFSAGQQLPNHPPGANFTRGGTQQEAGIGFGVTGSQFSNNISSQVPGPFSMLPAMLQGPLTQVPPQQGNLLQQRLDLPSTFNPHVTTGNDQLRSIGTFNFSNSPSVQEGHLSQQESVQVTDVKPISMQAPLLSRLIISMPPIDEGQIEHYSERAIVPLGIDEDHNWLSEFHCFVRGELIEIFRASHRDVSARYASKRVAYKQVGIRCRFCAHLPMGGRISRASAFPSSVAQIYQSFTMTVRDHIPACPIVPTDLKNKFITLKGKTSQGASDSKRYWSYSAKKRGLVDSSEGIIVNEGTIAAAQIEPPYGTTPDQAPNHPSSSPTMLLSPDDKTLISDFLFTLMSQAYLVHLTPSERMGNRKSLQVGLSGFGCRYCYQAGRLGLCRVFPARRRTLNTKTRDLYDHLKRCALCPSDIKKHLLQLEHQTSSSEKSSAHEKEFYDRLWVRLGHGASNSATTNQK